MKWQGKYYDAIVECLGSRQHCLKMQDILAPKFKQASQSSKQYKQPGQQRPIPQERLEAAKETKNEFMRKRVEQDSASRSKLEEILAVKENELCEANEEISRLKAMVEG